MYASLPSIHLPCCIHWVNCSFSQTLQWMKPWEWLGWGQKSVLWGHCFTCTLRFWGTVLAFRKQHLTFHLPYSIAPSFILPYFFCILCIGLFLFLFTFLWTSVTVPRGEAWRRYFSQCLCAQGELIDKGTATKGLLHRCSLTLVVEVGLVIGGISNVLG